MNAIHARADYDDFIKGERLVAEVEATAIKRMVAQQIRQEMAKASLSKSALAERMRTSRSALDRLLDPENASVTLQTLERVALTLGKRLKVEFV